MDKTTLYNCMVKGTKSEDAEPRYSQNWMFSRRGIFSIYNDKITCGDWTILFTDIKHIIQYKTKQLFIPVTVLHIFTNHGDYQFGFNPWAHPEKYLNDFIIEEKVVKLRYSIFSIIRRIILILFIITYFLYQYFIK